MSSRHARMRISDSTCSSGEVLARSARLKGRLGSAAQVVDDERRDVDCVVESNRRTLCSDIEDQSEPFTLANGIHGDAHFFDQGLLELSKSAGRDHVELRNHVLKRQLSGPHHHHRRFALLRAQIGLMARQLVDGGPDGVGRGMDHVAGLRHLERERGFGLRPSGHILQDLTRIDDTNAYGGRGGALRERRAG